MTEWSALRDALAGELVLPDAADYERVRKPADARFWDIRPAAVVRCRAVGDVVAALAFARRLGLHAVPRGGGHCFAGRSSTTGIVIDVAPMDTVEVRDGEATIGAGARLAHVYDALDANGVTIPAGCGPTVGIAGLVLGGGLGLLGRAHGLTSDRLLAAQVVLADGRVVECDERREPDLFWALRGAGGGQFGVATSLTFRTLPAPTVTTFELTWPQEHAETLIDAWQQWAPDAPDELTAGLRVATAGDEPATVTLFGAMIAGEAETAEQLARLPAEPATRAHRQLRYRDAKQSLAEPDDQTMHRFSRSELFRRPLPRSAIAALVHSVAQPAPHTRELHFTPLGGAYNRVPPEATAFAHRHERFMLEHAASIDAQRPGNAAAEWVARSWSSVRPWGSGRVYANFPDPALADWPQAYHGENHARLLAVKRRYDPDDVFRFDQSLA